VLLIVLRAGVAARVAFDLPVFWWVSWPVKAGCVGAAGLVF
jgi:hypothetical protein